MHERDAILADFDLLLKEVSGKNGPTNLGAPELITIEHDDYHAKYVGRTDTNQQVFVSQLFIPALSDQPGNEFLAIFLFSDIGNLVESRVDELGPRSSLNHELAAALLAQRLHELGNLTFHDIRMKPFAVEHFGTMMGLIPRKYDEQWCVELHPGNFMAFNEPWDSGIYDT